MQFIGSIGACDWKGASYTASIFLPAEASAAVGVAFFARYFVGGLRDQLRKHARDGGAALVGVRAFVPLDVENFAPLHGGPGAIGNHGDAVRNLDHVFDARHGLGFGRVETGNLAAEYRAARQHRVNHVRPLHVDAEVLLAGGFRARVQTLYRLADDLELLGVLGLRAGGDRQFVGGFRERAVAQLGVVRWIDDETIFGAEPRGRYAPLLRGGFDQHGAAFGSHLAQRSI